MQQKGNGNAHDVSKDLAAAETIHLLWLYEGSIL
jgi:hypothetical protein